MPPFLTILTFFFFFAGSLLLCFTYTIRPGWILLLLAYTLALITGQITLPGLLWLALTAAALFAAHRRQGWQSIVAHGVFVVLSLLLFMHLLPGFHNYLVFDHIRFTPDAAPFTMYLNLDKPFTGFILFTIYGFTKKLRIQAIVWPLLTISGLCLGTALLLHFIKWDPKLPPQAWIWVINNLLLVAVCEEAFFRGYLQGQLFKNKLVGIFITAVIFGVAHTTGGPALMLLAFIAGCGYGWAYYKGGILAAILTHFLFNVLHFFLFTYPMLAR